MVEWAVRAVCVSWQLVPGLRRKRSGLMWDTDVGGQPAVVEVIVSYEDEGTWNMMMMGQSGMKGTIRWDGWCQCYQVSHVWMADKPLKSSLPKRRDSPKSFCYPVSVLQLWQGSELIPESATRKILSSYPLPESLMIPISRHKSPLSTYYQSDIKAL